MGITGLIPFLENASSKINLKDVEGSTVAVDTYCWLHKGAFACADKLMRGEDTDIHIRYCLKYINLLVSHNIKPILVFDGRHLPAKALTEKRRRKSRNDSKKRSAELMRLGKIEEARSHMRRCVDITHEMALQLIKECRKRNIDCIVAPYEADAQLAYLNKIGIAQYVITEDSDLVLFGCNKIIFKLDLSGNCILVNSDKLHMTMGCSLEKFNFDKFRSMCILSGCDYLDSLPGIGLAKACKFFLKTEESNLKKALKHIPQYLNMKSLIVSDDYINSFLMAEATFKFMFVYDPFLRKMVRLNKPPEDIEDFEKVCSNAGVILEEEDAFDLALGNLNPFSLKKLDNWRPEDQQLLNEKDISNNKKYNKVKHKSIWQPMYEAHKAKVQQNIGAFLTKKISYNKMISENDEQKNNCDIDNENSLFSFYSQNIDTPLSKRQCRDNEMHEKNCSTILQKNHNPFIKISEEFISLPTQTQDLDSKISDGAASSTSNINDCNKLQRLSKFNRTIIQNENKEIKSRFFFSNTLIKTNFDDQNKLSETQKNSDLLKMVNDIENKCDSINKKMSIFYSPQKNLIDKNEIHLCLEEEFEITTSSQKENDIKMFEEMETNISNKTGPANCDANNDFIEISDTEEKLKSISLNSKKKVKNVGLNKKKSLTDINKAQTRLSLYGFKKREH